MGIFLILLGGCQSFFGVEGERLPALCTSSNEKRCYGNLPQTCGDDLEWHDGTPCTIDAPVCSAGECSRIRKITAGGAHACALLDLDGSIRCWGRNTSGELGIGTMGPPIKPTQVVGISGALDVKAGGTDDFGFTCAITAESKVKCWGFNGDFELANDERQAQNVPIEIDGLENVDRLAVGARHVCAALRDGTVMCWGKVGTKEWPKPHLFDKVDGIRDIDAGIWHTCLVTTAGRVRCWGINLDGQCGQAALSSDMLDPVDVPGITEAQAVATGDYHTCAIVKDAQSGTVVHCWGRNDCGQLGRGNYCDSHCPLNKELGCGEPTPAVVFPDHPNAVEISAGAYHSCMVTDDNKTQSVRCWGRNDFGQVGTNGELVFGVGRPFSTSPAATNDSHAEAISLGPYFGCALTRTGVHCWGRNDYGQLGADSNVQW